MDLYEQILEEQNTSLAPIDVFELWSSWVSNNAQAT